MPGLHPGAHLPATATTVVAAASPVQGVVVDARLIQSSAHGAAVVPLALQQQQPYTSQAQRQLNHNPPSPLAERDPNATPVRSFRLFRKPSPSLLARLRLLETRARTTTSTNSSGSPVASHQPQPALLRLHETESPISPASSQQQHLHDHFGSRNCELPVVDQRRGTTAARACSGHCQLITTAGASADPPRYDTLLIQPGVGFGRGGAVTAAAVQGGEGSLALDRGGGDNGDSRSAMAMLPHADSDDHSSIISTSDRIAPSDSEIEETHKFRLPETGKSRGLSRNGLLIEGYQTGIAGPDRPPTPPPKDSPMESRTNLLNGSEPEGSDVDSYFNPYGLSRTASVYTLGRASFTDQISQLTSIKLPQASSLSATITAIPTSAAAARALNDAADQIRRWIQKASEVLGGLDAEDDVEWAAAGGREGLGEVDAAINRFEELIDVYVGAVEHLESRSDIASLSSKELNSVVERMEKITLEWNKVKKTLKGVKVQVEVAMEWEDLWNNTLGQIAQEMDSLGRLVFQMEERRHKNSLLDPNDPSSHQLDFNELETIVEEAPSRNPAAGSRLSMVSALPNTDSQPQQRQSESAADESNLMSLFARMQPLRASLDFVPMSLAAFLNRGRQTFPTACEDLERRLEDLEVKYKSLDADAESLRKELGEDRWVLMFRKAGLKAIKMCESVDRSIAKLRDELDDGTQHFSPAVVSSKIHTYEQKKQHYCPNIQRVLDVFNRGVESRSTINGEVIRLQEELQRRWSDIESQTRAMDFALAQMDLKNQPSLRDSVSTILSQNTTASSVPAMFDTPGSSPASSVILLSRQNSEQGAATPASKSRAGSFASTTTLNSTKRSSMLPTPASARSSQLPMKTPLTRSGATDAVTPPSGVSSRLYSPPPTRSVSRAAAIEESKPSRPRWNSSTSLRDTTIGHNFKPLTLTTPSPYRKDAPSIRSPRSVSTPQVFSRPQPSPLGRGVTSASTLPHRPSSSIATSRRPSTPPKTQPRLRAQASTSHLSPTSKATAAAAANVALARAPRASSSMGTHTPQPSRSHIPRTSLYATPGTLPGTSAITPGASAQSSSTSTTSTATITQNLALSTADLDYHEDPDSTSGADADIEESPSARPAKASRPVTALSARRSSLLPQPRRTTSSVGVPGPSAGRDSRAGRRQSSITAVAAGSKDERRWRI